MRRRVSRSLTFSLLLTAIALCSGRPAEAQTSDDSPVILTIGESTTAGYGVPKGLSYPAQLQVLLQEHGYEHRVVNHGRNGISTSMALGGLLRGLLLEPKIVIIALGGNDPGSGIQPAGTRENLRKLVSVFVSTGAHVFLADRHPRADPSLFAELAAEEGAILMPPLTEGVADDPELLIEDGHHPNREGYAIVARRIFTTIEPYLEPNP